MVVHVLSARLHLLCFDHMQHESSHSQNIKTMPGNSQEIDIYSQKNFP